jgi:hypothetical protein
MKRIAVLLLLMTLVLNLTACSGGSAVPTQAASAVAATPARATATTQPAATAAPTRAAPTRAAASLTPAKADSAGLDANAADAVPVKLDGDKIVFTGKGAAVNGKVLTITKAGTYNLSGKLNDGQIVVDTKDAEKVVLILDGADITNATGAPIFVANAEKVVITLAAGTRNSVTDGAKYVFPDAQTDEPNAAIFSKDDLTINGAGSLTVKANYNNGIASKDDLKITGGTITVQAVNDGIKGRDSLTIKDGTLTVNAGADGLQANNDEDAKQGYIVIEGGTLNITAGKDAVQAETNLTISGGQLTLRAGGGSAVRKTAESAKGLKAGVDVVITGGRIAVDASDDAINANNQVTIGGGELTLATSDDGVHANVAFTLNGGDLRITKSYEGVESNQITINDGTLRLASSDDGINGTSATAPAAGGGMPPRGGPGGFAGGDSRLIVNGGYVAVDALGDGIDINGTIEMTGGIVLVNGPTANNNAALDHGGFKITGGFLVAAGSAGMAQAPDTTSTQYSLMHNFATTQAAGTLVHLATQDGKAIVTFAPTKTFQSIVISAPELKNGATYVVFSGGRSTGTATDSLVAGGAYTAGTQVASYTLTSVITGAGAGMGGPRGMRPPVRP